MIYGGENEQQSDHLLAQLSQVVIYLSTLRINLSLYLEICLAGY